MLDQSKKNHTIMPTQSQLVNELFGDLFAPINRIKHQIFGPATNIKETENEIQMEIVMPGVSKENIKLEIKDSTLTISFEKTHQSTIDSESFLRREFEVSNFTRSFTLAEGLQKDAISSKLENGILQITLPKIKATDSKSKTIDIQ